MASHEILGGKVQLSKRPRSRFWQCFASVGGRQYQASTKEEDLALAREAAEDWYLELRGKSRAGILKKREKTFSQAADQFLVEYETITEGERSKKWTEGHAIRLRVHLLPFLGSVGLSEVTPGKVQEYRVHRMTTWADPNPHSKSNRPAPIKPPSRSTLHNEIITLRLVLKTANRHGWVPFVPDLSPPYKTQGKVVHRPWFSPEEYKQLYTATRAYAKEPFHEHYRWNAEQLHDYVLFMANTGLRPDEAGNLEHRDVEIINDDATDEQILLITARGKRGKGYCKSMPNAVVPYRRLLTRQKPLEGETRRDAQRRRKAGITVAPEPSKPEFPGPMDRVFPGDHIRLFNGVLDRSNLKTDRDGKRRTAYSLRHTYICMRLSEGADIYQVAKNCRTSVEMIQKFYAAHISTILNAAAINVIRPKRRKVAPTRRFEDDEGSSSQL